MVLPVIAFMSMPMLADDPFPVEFHGYFRAGSGRSSEGGEQVAFQLPGASSKYRLGNETENYGELEFDAKVFEQDGAMFKVHTMAQFVNHFSEGSNAQGTDTNGAKRDVDMAQYWVEGTGILGDSDALKEASLWAGKRYYNRNDVHIIDFFYWNNQGNGFGIEKVNLGFGNFHYAYIQTDNDKTLSTTSTILTGQNIVASHDFRLSDMHVNPNGTLMVGLEFKEAKPYNTTSDTSNNNNGFQFNVIHTQSGIWGGDNKLALQYGSGAGATLSNTPDASMESADKTYRLVDSLTVQPNSKFGMQAVLVYQKTKDSDETTTTWTSFGGRPTFFFNQHFSLALDLGMDQVKPDTGDRLRLTKETLSLQWSPKPEFWSRPQIRLFMTSAQWNDAAKTAGIANGVFKDKTNGMTYGAQAEIWW
jgi:maltoporin